MRHTAGHGGATRGVSRTFPLHACPGWLARVSRREGTKYFSNVTTGLALWHDPALPVGWAWGKRTSTGAKFWLHLASGTSLPAPPTASQAAQAAQARGSSKRPRTQGGAQPPAKRSTSAWPKLPPVSGDDMDVPWPTTRPDLPATLDTSCFGEAHRRVLQQVVQGRHKVLLDLGAGTGAATLALADLRGEDSLVYAVDVWDAAFAAAHAAAGGQADTAAFYAALPQPMETHFHANVWQHANAVTALRASAEFAVRKLAYMGIFPNVVYVDAPREYREALRLLRSIVKNMAQKQVEVKGHHAETHIVGGGWEAPGVQAAVQATAAEFNLTLHVEVGKVWTFSPQAIRDTANLTDTATLAAVGQVAAAAAVDIGETPQDWVAGVGQLLRDRADLPAIQAHLAKHALILPEGTSAAEVAAAVAAAPPHLQWVDCSANDKRRLTPLMQAAQAGREDVVELLLRRCGAGVNVQAPDSRYTALNCAAWSGHADVVAMLLEAGADANLTNRFRETPLVAARKAGRSLVVQLLEPVTAPAAGGGGGGGDK